MRKTFLLSLIGLSIGTQAQQQEPITMNVDVSQWEINISPTHYGLFFEDINNAADGGLYAELIRNRSFEESTSTPDYWSNVKNHLQTSGTATLSTTNLLNDTQGKALRVNVSKLSKEDSYFGVMNTGFWGINIVDGRTYQLTFFARCEEGFDGKLTAALVPASIASGNTKPYASVTIEEPLTTQWQKYSCTLTAEGNNPAGRFMISTQGTGTFYLDVVSLFPPTFKGHANGCRPELAQLLADMNPKFLRFPGGCFIEGDSRENLFHWKKTIGPIEERAGHWNHWGYPTSDGMGYHEFLQLSEDIGATPLYVVNIGIWHGGFDDYKNIGEYIQDALDAIEYANGDASTTYGAMRIANGHPEPFNMYLIEIGNENYQANASQQSDHYAERYIQFYNAIKEKYPYMQLIGNVESWGTDFPTWRNSYPVDIVDEHYYRTPAWFAATYHKYDSYSRAHAKVYAGEYAVTSDCGNGNLNAALGEAIYMLGMENNSDVVIMNSYAPIFKNENTNNWAIDMIHFNSGKYYCTPSYYVQQLFPNHIGTKLVHWNIENNEVTPTTETTHLGIGSWSTVADFDDVKVTDAKGNILLNDEFVSADNWTPALGTWSVQNGIYHQSSTATNCTSIANTIINTSTYTYSLRARKNSGNEGFLIIFDYQDAENYSWWNIGGWGNTQHGIECCTDNQKITVSSVGGSLITGEWYDICIEKKGSEVKCYLNNQLIHTATVSANKKVYANATLDEDEGMLHLKLVNPSASACRTVINLTGCETITACKAIVMAGTTGLEENSMNAPTNVAPSETTLTPNGLLVTYDVPPYSVNIIDCELTGIKKPADQKAEPLPAPMLSYSFENETIGDDNNRYPAEMLNGASIFELFDNKMLATGNNNGYVNLGSNVGKEIFSNLGDFTLSADIYNDTDNNLASAGNFILNFSNMNNVEWSTRNNAQYIFMGAKDLAYTINNLSFDSQQSVGHNMNLGATNWDNVVYVQQGNTGTLYLNGNIVQRNEKMTIHPSDFADKLIYNWIGRSCWTQDSYLKNAYIDNILLFDRALTGTFIEELGMKRSTLNTQMSIYKAIQALELTNLTGVTSDLALPTSIRGCNIRWSTSNAGVITANGKVTCPETGTATAILTATIAIDTYSMDKSFTVTVNEKPSSVLPLQTENLLKIETGVGYANITASSPALVNIYSANGVLFKCISINKGEQKEISIPHGVYLINGNKIAIK